MDQSPTAPRLSSLQERFLRQHLYHDGIIAYPTEAVYGLGCDPLNPTAVERLLELKSRPATKGLILIAADLQQLDPYIKWPDQERRALVAKKQPQPTTWVVPAAQWVPEWLVGEQHTIAVRVTTQPIAAQLCQLFGGVLVSTSANHSGKPAARTPLKVRQLFPSADLMIIHGATGGFRSATPIYQLIGGRRLR